MKIAEQQVWECFHSNSAPQSITWSQLEPVNYQQSAWIRDITWRCVFAAFISISTAMLGHCRESAKKHKTKGKTWPNISTVHTPDMKTCVIGIKKMSDVSRDGKLWRQRHLDWWLCLRIWAAAFEAPSWIAQSYILRGSSELFPAMTKEHKARAELTAVYLLVTWVAPITVTRR